MIAEYYAAAHDHARHSLAETSRESWRRPFVPGSIQVISGRSGRPLLPDHAVCRTQRAAGGSGGPGRDLALGKPLATDRRKLRAASAPQPLAASPAGELDQAGQPAAARNGTGVSAAVRRAWPSLRQPIVGGDNCRATGAASNASSPRPATRLQRNMNIWTRPLFKATSDLFPDSL